MSELDLTEAIEAGRDAAWDAACPCGFEATNEAFCVRCGAEAAVRAAAPIIERAVWEMAAKDMDERCGWYPPDVFPPGSDTRATLRRWLARPVTWTLTCHGTPLAYLRVPAELAKRSLESHIRHCPCILDRPVGPHTHTERHRHRMVEAPVEWYYTEGGIWVSAAGGQWLNHWLRPGERRWPR